MKLLSDLEIVNELKIKCAHERTLTLEILNLLMQVEDRRLYAKRAYPSLHEFCVKELKYSSGAAWRRIESMRLLRDVPQCQDKLESGELSLSVLAQVQTYVRQEQKNGKPVPQEEKTALVASFEGKSAREVQKVLVTLNPMLAPKFQEKMKQISETTTLIKIVADEELMELLHKVKQLSGLPGEDLAMLLKKLARSYIGQQTTTRQVKSPTSGNPGSRYIRKEAQIAIRNLSGGQCQFKDQSTLKRCDARTALQLDHIVPYGKGGQSVKENLQILCTAHNRLKAINEFGEAKMRTYLKF